MFIFFLGLSLSVSAEAATSQKDLEGDQFFLREQLRRKDFQNFNDRQKQWQQKLNAASLVEKKKQEQEEIEYQKKLQDFLRSRKKERDIFSEDSPEYKADEAAKKKQTEEKLRIEREYSRRIKVFQKQKEQANLLPEELEYDIKSVDLIPKPKRAFVLKGGKSSTGGSSFGGGGSSFTPSPPSAPSFGGGSAGDDFSSGGGYIPPPPPPPPVSLDDDDEPASIPPPTFGEGGEDGISVPPPIFDEGDF